MSNSIISAHRIEFLIPAPVFPFTQAQDREKQGICLPQNRNFSKNSISLLSPSLNPLPMLSLSLSLFRFGRTVWLTVSRYVRVINFRLIEAEQKAVTVLVHFILNFEFLSHFVKARCELNYSLRET